MQYFRFHFEGLDERTSPACDLRKRGRFGESGTVWRQATTDYRGYSEGPANSPWTVTTILGRTPAICLGCYRGRKVRGLREDITSNPIDARIVAAARKRCRPLHVLYETIPSGRAKKKMKELDAIARPYFRPIYAPIKIGVDSWGPNPAFGCGAYALRVSEANYGGGIPS